MMDSRRKIVVYGGAVLVAIAITAIFLARSPRPNLYRGKSVREWVALLDPQSGQEKRREDASWALVQLGNKALPDLEAILAWRRNRLVDAARGYAIRFGLARPSSISPLDLQSLACEAAFNLAERAEVDISRLVPHLRYHLTNGTYADSNSARALVRAGPDGIAVLTNLVLTGTINVRAQAGWALHFTNKRPEAIAALIQSASSDPLPQLRAEALLYLQGSHGAPEALVPLGLGFLHSDDGYARWTAATLLQDYVSKDEVRVALQAALTDTDSRVRGAAERALKQ
jgi:hypothetical protein